MIEQTPTRRRTLNTWRALNENRLVAMPTQKAADLLSKSYVISREQIVEIKANRKMSEEVKANRAQEFPCNNCTAKFKTEKGLKIHKRNC